MDEHTSYDIEVAHSPDQSDDVDEPHIRQAIELALSRHGCLQASLSVALVTDERMADLNQQYLQHAGPTDVLSFDLSEEGSEGVEGQLIVSVDTARREAARRGHSVRAEMLLYCVHGTLHLLGYDDADAEDARRMHSLEDELLTELGVGAVYGDADS